MKYGPVIALIFTLLVGIIFLLEFVSSSAVMFLLAAAIPLLVIIQAVYILHTKDESAEEPMNQWYENH